MIAGQVKDTARSQEMTRREIEIASFKKKLENFGIRLYELSKLTPACTELRTKAIEVAKQLALDLHIIESIKTEQSLPEEKISQVQSVFPLHLPYIIAMTVLFVEEYSSLTSFLNIVD